MDGAIEKALAALRSLSADRQEELAAAVIAVAAAPARAYTAAENVALDEGLADADAGRFISDAELQRTLDRFDGN